MRIVEKILSSWPAEMFDMKAREIDAAYTVHFCFVFCLFCSSNTNDPWLLLMLEFYLVKSFVDMCASI